MIKQIKLDVMKDKTKLNKRQYFIYIYLHLIACQCWLTQALNSPHLLMMPTSPSLIVFIGRCPQLCFHLFGLSSTSCLSKSWASLFQSACSTSQFGRSYAPHRVLFVCVCVLWHRRRRRGWESLCSPQLKGRGITGTQTLIKAFQPPMAPLILS